MWRRAGVILLIMGNLLILGAGQYGMVAKEIAESMHIFDKIDFLDDNNPIAVGKLNDYPRFKEIYEYAVAAIGNADMRLNLISDLKNTGYKVTPLVHEKAYVSPSASIAEGCFVEPMVVVHTDVKVGAGCIISAGVILNHNSVIEQGCHIDCGTIVAARKLIKSNPRTAIGSIVE